MSDMNQESVKTSTKSDTKMSESTLLKSLRFFYLPVRNHFRCKYMIVSHDSLGLVVELGLELELVLVSLAWRRELLFG